MPRALLSFRAELANDTGVDGFFAIPPYFVCVGVLPRWLKELRFVLCKRGDRLIIVPSYRLLVSDNSKRVGAAAMSLPASVSCVYTHVCRHRVLCPCGCSPLSMSVSVVASPGK